MASELTTAADLASQQTSITPQLVLEINGVETVYGVLPVQKYAQVGDVGLLVGGDWVIGGLVDLLDQSDTIDLKSSSSKIQQQLEPDKGSVSSIPSVQVSLIDYRLEASQLVSPGFVLEDILAKKARVMLGFVGTGYPTDFVPIFAGIIDDVECGAGIIKLNIASPEQLKRQMLFPKVETALSGGINNSVTTLPVTSTASFSYPYSDTPTAVIDTSITYYVRIDDEIIKYTAVNSTNFLTCTRAQLGTTAASHSSGAQVQSFYTLAGSAMDLALKLMLSGKNGYWAEDVPAESFVAITGEYDIDDTVFFPGVDIESEYGVVTGDFITISGASNGANNVTLAEIAGVTKVDTGSYILVDGVTFVRETDTAAVVSFRSQYDTLGMGLAMDGDQVDVAEHVYLNESILATNSSYLFYIKENFTAKDFMDKEIYAPMGAYSIPRKGRCSVGYHLGPVPRSSVPIITKDLIKSPGKIKIRRSINKNFYNTVLYQVDESPLEDKFFGGFVYYDADSRNRIAAGTRAMQFKAKGIRTDNGGAILTDRVASRLLNRYRLGAEYIENLELFFKAGFNVEPGDLVVIDFTDLQVTNIQDGTRDKPAKIYEVINRSLDLRTGDVSINVIDTNFDLSERYGVIAPSSLIDAGSTDTVLLIKDSYEEFFPNDEGKKWENYVGLKLRVHSLDFSFDEEVTLSSINSANTHELTVTPALSGAPDEGYIVDLVEFPDNTDSTDQNLAKIFHAYLAPTVEVVTGVSSTSFTVGAGDIAKFLEGATVLVHSVDYVTESEEVKVVSAVGVTVTVDTALGFTPSAGQVVDLVGFPDSSPAYRFV